MLTLDFTCSLPNGLHARPASELELRTLPYQASITLLNLSKDRQADAKSVLAMIGADITYGDQCQLQIQGADQDQAFQALNHFLQHEFADSDQPLVTPETQTTFSLPPFFQQHELRYLAGRGVSPGIGLGKALHIDSVDLASLALQAPEQSADQIHALLQNAWQTTLDHYQKSISQADSDSAQVLAAQHKLLADSAFHTALLDQPQARNSLQALVLAAKALSQPLLSSSSQYLRERVLDIEDICLRLANQLTEQPLSPSLHLQQDSIVVTQGLLTPGQFLQLRSPHLKGIVMGEGGETSHTVILARSFGVPLLCNVIDSASLTRSASSLLIDSRHGMLIADPDAHGLRWHQLEQQKQQRISARSAPLRQRQITTQDGQPLQIAANIAIALEAEGAFAQGADGIGLFRTEMLFCERQTPPDEEEQYQSYRQVVEQAAGKKVIIRTLDIGGDKPCDYLALPPEENPFLGYRAVRLYAQFLPIFQAQARALLRASAAGPLHIMIPMITTLDEVKWVHQQFQQLAQDLQSAGVTLGEWHLGIMVEVPAAFYLLDKLAPWIDFVSIGSNDLTQYFLACDRGNAQVRHLYNSQDPSLLAFMRDIIQRANANGLSVSLCGEMAADPLLQPLLVGMGLTQFSLSAAQIATSKERLASLQLQQCQTLLAQVLASESTEQVAALLQQQQAANAPLPMLATELVLLDQEIGSKAEAIKVLTDNLEVAQRVSSGQAAEQAIWQREAVFSTALGFAVALPHCKSSAVLHSSISLLRLKQPLRWGEDEQVSLVIMLTVNDQQQGDHMKIFSRLARKLMHSAFREQLQTSSDPQTLVTLLTNELAF